MTARPILQGAGIATLYVTPFAAAFLTPSLGYAYHRLYPLTPIFRAIFLLTLLLWLGGALAFIVIERLSLRWKRVFWFFPIVLLPWLFVHCLAGVLSNSPTTAIAILHVGRLFTIGVAVVAPLLLFAAPRVYDRCVIGISMSYVIAGFGLLVIIPRIGLHALHSGRQEQPGFVRDRLPSVSPSAPRIVWILMDELSYNQAFAARPPDLRLPNFDRLAESSVAVSDLQPDGAETVKVLPSLLLGTPIVDFRAPYPGVPLYRSRSGGSWQRFNQYDTIFADAHSLGWTTGVAGWYNPYCRLLPDVLDRCFWVYTEPVGSDFAARLTTTKSVSENLRAMIPAKFDSMMKRPAKEPGRNHADDYISVMTQAKDLIDDSRIRFVFVHLPIPHPPGIYDRRRHAMSDSGTYLDNLALADQALGTLRDTIQSTSAAPDTTLIVSSDHSWRTFMWKPYSSWSADEEHASHGGKFDDRPVLMVHLPGCDASHLVSTPVNLLIIHSILESLLRGQIHTAAGMDELIEKQTPQKMEKNGAKS